MVAVVLSVVVVVAALFARGVVHRSELAAVGVLLVVVSCASATGCS